MMPINQSVKVLTPLDSKVIDFLEDCARVCYQSEKKGERGSLIRNLILSKHGSVLEHFSVTVHITTSRSVLAELTRHRLASFSVESTRYCNYGKDKFDNQLTFVQPIAIMEEEDAQKKIDLYAEWLDSCYNCERNYLKMLERGATTDQAREVLNNSLKCEIRMTANIREWLYAIFPLRTSKQAHPQIRSLISTIRDQFMQQLPELFPSDL